MPGGFHHAAQGVRVVTEIERDLDLDARGGLMASSSIPRAGRGRSSPVGSQAYAALTREARVARAADSFAYACHDFDDAYSLGALHPAHLPPSHRHACGRHRQVESLVARTVREKPA